MSSTTVSTSLVVPLSWTQLPAWKACEALGARHHPRPTDLPGRAGDIGALIMHCVDGGVMRGGLVIFTPGQFIRQILCTTENLLRLFQRWPGLVTPPTDHVYIWPTIKVPRPDVLGFVDGQCLGWWVYNDRVMS